MFQSFLQHDAAIGAGGDQRLCAGLFQLCFLHLECGEAQFLCFLDRAHSATAAATPVHLAGIIHLDEILRD